MMAGMTLFLASCYFSIAVNSLALGVMAIGWAASMVVHRRWLAPATPLDFFFLAYVAAEMLSTLFSINQSQALFFSRRLLLIGIVYFLAGTLSDDRLLGRAVAILLGAAVTVALVGMVKLLVAHPEDTVRLGIFQFYMTTSGVMMIASLLLLAFAVGTGVPQRVRLFAVAGLAPVLIALYATVTRGAYLAFAVGALVIALIRNRKIVIPLLAVLILLVVFAPPYVESRIKSMMDLSHPENASRLMLWGVGLKIFGDHRVTGVGDIDLGELFVQYGATGPERWGHLHNIALQILITLGAIGFVAVAALFVRIAWVEWKVYRAVRGNWLHESVALGALAVFAGFQVHGLTEWTLGDQEVAILFWSTVGFSLAAGRIAASVRSDKAVTGRP